MLKLSKKDNNNIVKLLDYLESKSNCYLIMEYCEGGDLESKNLK